MSEGSDELRDTRFGLSRLWAATVGDVVLASRVDHPDDPRLHLLVADRAQGCETEGLLLTNASERQ